MYCKEFFAKQLRIFDFFAKFLDKMNSIWFVFYRSPFLWHYQLHLAYAKHDFELGKIMLGHRRSQGPGPPPIKIPPMIKNYDNIVQRCLVAVTDDNGAPGSLANNQGALGPPTNDQRTPGPPTNNQEAPGSLTDKRGPRVL